MLKLVAESKTDYELEKNDIINLFSRYGKIVDVNVNSPKTAFVIFNDIISALCAQKSLNGHYLKDVDVRLNIEWCNDLNEGQ
mmetsp:Transcript_6029/g.5374  ORF Transcript_6029/g.5374 Transcript_6029/m.5374 type:complete len:82 (-) Transcript_6029:2500-2745(-)